MDRWSGRVALVTGASGGIGASIAERLVKHGMKVAGCARNVQAIQILADKVKGEKGELFPIECDLRKEEDILHMFSEIKQKYGGVDVCINSAGLAEAAPLENGETEKWRNMLEVNVLALCICTREAIQSMKSRGVDDGHIIHINSLLGHKVPESKVMHMYSATKHAVTALTEGLRNELRSAKSNIRISALSPGAVKTNFLNILMGEEGAKTFSENYGCLQPDDVTEGVIYCLSAPPHVQVHDVLCTHVTSLR